MCSRKNNQSLRTYLRLRFRVHELVMLLFGIFMPYALCLRCHDLFWLCTAPCRPGTDIMTCMGKKNLLGCTVLGCLSQGLSTHDMTWHLDLASILWPGYLLCPLSHILLETRWIWDRGRGNHHSGIGWLPATLKDRLSAGSADMMSGGALHHEQVGKRFLYVYFS